jgi:hypothetical protein
MHQHDPDLTKECSVYIHESEYAWAIIKKGASQQLYFWKCKKGTAKTVLTLA